MSVQSIIIILLLVGLIFLVVHLVKNVILPRQATTDYRTRAKILQAVKTAKAAVERDPKSAEAHFLLGKAFLADKREEQAFREYRSASRLGITGRNIPETEFRETIAGLYTKFHEPEEALKEYILLIKKYPENPEYYFQAGKLFPGRNRRDLAEQYLRKAVTLNPAEERYHFELGVQYYLGKKNKYATEEFEAVLKVNPSNGNAQLYLGKIFKTAKDYAAALPYLEKAARDHEQKLPALVELGSCYISLRMVDKAIMELERAVNVIVKEDEPDSLYARYFLAMCYEKSREFGKAIAQWEIIYAHKKSFRDVGQKLTQYIEYKQENMEKEAAGKS
ncbi:MAG: tetratricopeptide repeat protein [Treponema sp.]|nr:tetratricopeptide repeat protein [Treponema sp.]